MKQRFTLNARIRAIRAMILKLGNNICYHLAETEEDLEIATLLLNADKNLSEAQRILIFKEFE